jgi:hypothetical protein
MAITGPPSPASPMTAVGDAGQPAGDAETLRLQHGHVLGGGTGFLEIQLRHAPDAIAQCDIGVLLGFDPFPDIGTVLHDGTLLHDGNPGCGCEVVRPA